jgi:RND family efflux transporter MFP subunit
MKPYPSKRTISLLMALTSRRGAAIGVGVIALSAASFFFTGHESAAAPEHKPATNTASVTVNAVAPVQSTFDRTIAATGTVTPRDELIIGSDASGVRLTDVLVEVGSTVAKGQLLARADDAQLRAQLAQQDALVKQAQVELDLALANADRAERLKDSGVYSVETAQTRKTSALAARAKLDLALAQRRELEVKIGYTRVVAPAAGVISKKAATVGAVVQPGAEMFRLIRDGQLEWLAELPNHSIGRVQAGSAVRVMLDDGRAIDAKVRMLAPTIDANTRNGLVHVALPKDAPFKAGGHAKGEILIASAQALAIPESSVLTRDGYSFVYVIGGDAVARMTKIETGARQRGLVEITAGLEPHARVVGTGAGFVKDGDLVRVAPDSNPRIAHAGGRS